MPTVRHKTRLFCLVTTRPNLSHLLPRDPSAQHNRFEGTTAKDAQFRQVPTIKVYWNSGTGSTKRTTGYHALLNTCANQYERSGSRNGNGVDDALTHHRDCKVVTDWAR
jgi:hypothetical protein